MLKSGYCSSMLVMSADHPELSQEREAVDHISVTVNDLKARLAKVKAQSDALELELNKVRKEVNSERAEKERQRTTLEEMRARDAKEIEELETAVGLKITTATREFNDSSEL